MTESEGMRNFNKKEAISLIANLLRHKIDVWKFQFILFCSICFLNGILMDYELVKNFEEKNECYRYRNVVYFSGKRLKRDRLKYLFICRA